MLQERRFDEAAFRNTRFKDWQRDVRGNNDLLILTQPDAVREIHLAYFQAGADIVSTNTFSSTVIAQADYGMESLVPELNRVGAQLVREAAMAQKRDGRPRFVAGAMGPTNRTASISPDVNNPGFRAVSFDELKAAYAEQAAALLEGGVDILLVETIFDTLNAKAALYAIAELEEARGEKIPVMISGTITDLSGRMLAGQTPEAFWNAIRHATPLVGRAELRARRQGNARAYRRAVARCRHADLRLSECRAAERVRALRREPGAHGGPALGIRRLGHRQHRGRLLRHDARTHARDRAGRGRQEAARHSGHRAAAAAVRARAVHADRQSRS